MTVADDLDSVRFRVSPGLAHTLTPRTYARPDSHGMVA